MFLSKLDERPGWFPYLLYDPELDQPFERPPHSRRIQRRLSSQIGPSEWHVGRSKYSDNPNVRLGTQYVVEWVSQGAL